MQRPQRRPAWLLVAAVTVAACSASPDEGPPADQSADAVVREADSGTQLQLRPGQRLRVVLGADFTPVETSAAGVLDPVTADGGYPTGQPLTAVLTAVAPGQVSLSSATDAACLHESPPCALPQQQWTLSVTVESG